MSGLKADDVWTLLTSELALGTIIGAVTKGSSFTYKDGIVNSHEYAVLSAKKLSNGVRLVKCSNPWGRDAYTGTWSDSSSLWTDALRKEVGSVNNEGDGVFFMTVETLVADFDGLEYIKDVSTWKKTSWLNVGKDVKTKDLKANYCKTANCRVNKFNLTSKDNQ